MIEVSELKKMITVSCGIGRSFEEEAKAVAEAKKNKGKNDCDIFCRLKPTASSMRMA
ncbi:MAG: hypothetical protein ACPLXC_02930 [Candidatus Pacearchaeota archaeon]